MVPISKERLKLLIRKYMNSDLTENEDRELNDFGAAYPHLWLMIARLQDKEQFTRDVEELQSIDTEKALAASLSQIKQLKPGQGVRRLLLLRPAAAIAIGILALLTLTGITLWKMRSSATQLASLAITYRTVTNSGTGPYMVPLPDGSKIWLNKGSTLKYPSTFTGKTRDVDFTGEAYFEIKGNTSIPFLVHVNDGLLVHVLGTSFNIAAYRNEKITRTTVLTGSVKISIGSREQIVTHDQQLVIPDNKEWVLLQKVDSNTTTAWKNAPFSFNNTSLRIAMEQLSNYFGIAIVIEGSDSFPPCNGVLQKDLPLLKILDQLELRHRLEGNKLIIFR